jgi:hypothetical protein
MVFLSRPPDKRLDNISIRPRLLPYKFFPIHLHPTHVTLRSLDAESVVKQHPQTNCGLLLGKSL